MATLKGTLDIGPDGQFKINVTETPGGTICRSTMQPLVDALGGDEAFEPKPEYFQGQESEPVMEVMTEEAQEQAFI